MSEIVVEGDDYWFTTDQWSRYTGRQILVAAALLTAFTALLSGVLLVALSFGNVFISTPDGVLIASEAALGDFLWGTGLMAIGASFSDPILRLWPWPWEYGQRIEEADSR